MLDVISDDSDSLNNLVNDLLDLSKMESGKIVMDIKEFDISKTIIEVKKSFKMQLEEKKVGLNIDINRVRGM